MQLVAALFSPTKQQHKLETMSLQFKDEFELLSNLRQPENPAHCDHHALLQAIGAEPHISRLHTALNFDDAFPSQPRLLVFVANHRPVSSPVPRQRALSVRSQESRLKTKLQLHAIVCKWIMIMGMELFDASVRSRRQLFEAEYPSPQYWSTVDCRL